MANSCVDSLPRMIAPAWRSLAITAASALATLSTRIFEWQVVGRPATSMMSLMPTGTPCSGPRTRPAAISVSAARAASIAASASSRMKACSFGSSRSMRASSAVSSSTGERRRAANSRAASAAVSQCSSLTARSPRASAARVPRRDRWGSRSHPGCRVPVPRRARRRRGTPPAPCPGRPACASFAIRSLSISVSGLPAPIMRSAARERKAGKERRCSEEPHRPRGSRRVGATSGRKQDTGQSRLRDRQYGPKKLMKW